MKTLFSVLLVLGACVRGHGQCSGSSVNDQLISYTATLVSGGYPFTAFTDCGNLQEGASDYDQVYLNFGYTYQIYAVCDEDCPDLDLSLYDGSGTLLKYDGKDDSFPIITFTPEISGAYVTQVKMYSCTRGPCAYGLRIQSQPN
ncbi:hypothetical protein [Lewinella sp. IMCC34183]|uniref:hypothetical protein n=1 Tax=Lewinella sp. IMCC34183 TaxID=2248762 RepID=UPI00130094B3|nr:hypothetical protein [Lewinella sp. IMCC34183]